MAEYVSNSNKAREKSLEPIPEKKIAPVVTGTRARKKTGFSKVAESIIVEDAKSVGSYILTDVVIPMAKKLIDDIVCNAIHMALYGKAAESRGSSTASRISYNNMYRRTNEEPLTAAARSSVFEFDDVVFETKGDAEVVLEIMGDIIESHKQVNVGEFYELADMPCPNYTVNKYGWTNRNAIINAPILRCDGGFVIQLPKVKEL